jgi:c-di-GMP-binding flagellar brake protein YcgR
MTDKNAKIVHDAVARSVSTLLSLPSAGMFRNHRSRFISDFESGILMQAPGSDRALIAELVRNKTPCMVSFRKGIYNVIFAAPIRRAEPRWRLNDHTMLDALLMEFPSEIKVVQRRAHHRIEIPPHTEIAVRVCRLAGDEDVNAEPPGDREVTAEVRDVSVGGIGVKLIGSDGKKPKICAEDRLRIVLMFEGQGLVIEGQIRPPAVPPTGDTIITGIKFKVLEDNLEDRRTSTRLLQIVGELQRRELRMAKLGVKRTA